MAQIKLLEARGTPGYMLAQVGFPPDDLHTLLIQTDWDYPGIARDFGWSMAEPGCDHSGTDGTIDCPECGARVSQFINEAAAFLDDNIGAVADDPGYFD